MKKSIELKWRKLDNTAKIFPIISNKNFSSVFRLSCVLSENIQKEMLYDALIQTLETFKVFKVKLKKGFFWYYFETNLKSPIIEEEHTYPCKNINTRKNNNYLFKVTYYKNKINLEIFHSITDGNGAIIFFKAIIYKYLDLKYKLKLNLKDNKTLNLNIDDGYLKKYKKTKTNNLNLKRAYNLKGKLLPLYAISVIHGHINLEDLKRVCKAKNVTITEYLTTVLLYSLYKGNFLKSKSKLPIKIYIPVNLRKILDFSTLSNFFSYISVERNFRKMPYNSFDDLLEYVKNEFSTKLITNKLNDKISSNVSAEKNIFIRIIPLFIKKIGIKLGYMQASKHHTSTLSNIGIIDIDKNYEKYIKNFLFLIAPTKAEKIKCSVCSFKNDLTFTFTSCLNDTNVEKIFFTTLLNNNINLYIESNGVYNEKM